MKTCGNCGHYPVDEGDTCPQCGAASVTAAIRKDTPPTVISDSRGSRRKQSKPKYAPGFVYAERYRIDAFLGSGGMGAVYRVHDLKEQRDLALKVLHAALAADPDGAERFRREMDMLSRVQHPAVPRVHGRGANGSELYFVAELIEGESLRTSLARRGRWPPAEAGALTAQIADALHAAHLQGIVHRDVKPGNIMIDAQRNVRLLDFGVARTLGHDLRTLTRAGIVMGTPEYMSPEQFESHHVDGRSDIYSLGIVLFEMLAGAPPFQARTPVAVAIKHKEEPIPSLRSLRRDIPSWLEQIVKRCLEKDPVNRFQTASELRDQILKPHSFYQRLKRMI